MTISRFSNNVRIKAFWNILTALGVCELVVLGLAAGFEYSGLANDSPKALEKKYREITEQMNLEHENEGYLSENCIKEIVTYNKRVRAGRETQNDFWIGIFIPNGYDDLEIIDVNNSSIE